MALWSACCWRGVSVNGFPGGDGEVPRRPECHTLGSMLLRECCRAASVRGGRAINKIEAPKPRRWGKKLNSYPLPAVPGIAQKDHAALLLLLRLRMNQDEHLPVVD